MITVTMQDADAALLATLMHRLTWEDVMRRSTDKAECERTLEACERLRQNLEAAPRKARPDHEC